MTPIAPTISADYTKEVHGGMVSRGHIYCVNDITRKLRGHSHSIPKESSRKSDLLKEEKRADVIDRFATPTALEDPVVV